MTASRRTPPGRTTRVNRSGRREIRVYGVAACRALFARRPEDIVRVFIAERDVRSWRELVTWCARLRRPYRAVSLEELRRVSGSEHHEGVCCVAIEPPRVTLEDLAPRSDRAAVLVLDGVENPHNIGSLLRSGAHFGIAGIIVLSGQSFSYSGALCRTAEGGAEIVPIVTDVSDEALLDWSRRSKIELIVTEVSNGGLALHEIPRRVAFVLGSERHGVRPHLRERISQRVSIPGTGLIDSLNVATAGGVLLSWWAGTEHRALKSPPKSR